MVDWSGFQIARDRIQPESSWSCYRCTLNSSKRAVPKTAEATGDLIGNKVADKITKALKTSPQNNWETAASGHEERNLQMKSRNTWWSEIIIIT